MSDERWPDLLGDLVIGARCPSCERPSVRWCPDCRARMTPDPVVESVGGLVVASSLEYGGVAQASIVAWKTSQRRDVHRGLVDLAVVAMAALLCVVTMPDELSLVPVPTSRRSRRERGMRLVESLATDVARSWRSRVDTPSLTCARLVRLVREPLDQAGLGADDRIVNLAGAMGCSDARGRNVVLIDDVVTTGATLAEATRAVTVAGGSVVGAVVVARVGRIRRNSAGK